MWDSSNVILCVLENQLPQVFQILEEVKYPCNAEHHRSDGCVDLEFYDVEYGNLTFLKVLENKGIAYESSWCPMDEILAGTEYCRFTDVGEVEITKLYTGFGNPPMDKLETLLDTPEKLVEYIRDYKIKTTPLPWDNQEINSKRYLFRQLITN